MPDETIEELKLKAIQLTYPAKDDGKGSARVNWQRRGYYFGKHNTNESFQLFCEWRSRLIETSEPTEVRVIRRDLAHAQWLATQEQHETSQSRSVSHMSLGLCAIGLLAFSASFATFLSAPRIVTVEERSVPQSEPLQEPLQEPTNARTKARIAVLISLKPHLKGKEDKEGLRIIRKNFKQLDAEKKRSGTYDTFVPVFE